MWLLESSVRHEMQAALKAGVSPSADQQERFEARLQETEESESDSRLLHVSGRTAEISIKGIITQSPSFLAMIFGGGNPTYKEIVSAIQAAEGDSRVRETVLLINSRGGHFDGLFTVLEALNLAKKPIKARIENVGASAAFAIASQADEIEASNISTRIGSVGVATSFVVSQDDIEITSTAAPKKRPDVTTEEGRAIVREELDEMHKIFAEAISEGRHVSIDKVNADFGEGATVLAEEALKRGMIDSIAAGAPKSVRRTKTNPANSGKQPELKIMDLNTLKDQHPDTFAAAVQVGIDKERDRVAAHLILGESSGDMNTAATAIKDGSEMTAILNAKYMSAAMNKKDVSERALEDQGASAGDNAHKPEDEDKTSAVAGIVEAKLGIQSGEA